MNELETPKAIKELIDIDRQVLELESDKLNIMLAMAKKAPFKKGHIVKANGAIYNGKMMKVDRVEFVECDAKECDFEYAYVGHGKVYGMAGTVQRRTRYTVYCDVYGRMSENRVDI